MLVEEAVLFLSVAALALALVVVVVGPKLRARAIQGRSHPLSEPVARSLTQGLAGLGQGPAGDGVALTCPICHREFEVGNRFCPLDSGRLMSMASAAIGVARATPPPAPVTALGGKICPICARHFGSEATFCGRDGSALVSVN